jgi:hypothetical protein
MKSVKRVTSDLSSQAPDVAGACWPAGLVLAAALSALPAFAQTSPAATQAFENAKFHYNVSLPVGCRHDEDQARLRRSARPEFDAEKSATASAAASMVLEVSTEVVADDAGKPPADLAQRYGEAQFKEELPAAVCGESDKARVKISNAKQVLEEARVVYTADVGCPEIKFLGLGERQAIVQVLITPGLRYRLMARALKEDFEQKKPAIDAFLTSFRVMPAK